MPAIVILGLVFVVGLFIFYLVSTKSDASEPTEEQHDFDDLKKEENVIFLPNDIEGMKERHRKK